VTSVAPKLEPSRLAPGRASLTVELVAHESAVTSAFATSPLKLLTPRSRGRSAWACLSNFGGGLVAGDQTSLELEVGAGAACFLGTQASTKIYRNPLRRACGHTTRARLSDGAFLVFAPDVVQAFADSTFAQRQEFHLAPTAGLVLVDWLASGRTERGEQWAFRRYQSRNEVFVAGERRVIDSLLLEPAKGPLPSGSPTGRYHCLATLLLVGPPLAEAAEVLLAEVGAHDVPCRAALVASVSPVTDGALLRVAGETVESVRHELHRRLAFLPALLGDDPWARKG
jgi:urease accessory protein